MSQLLSEYNRRVRAWLIAALAGALLRMLFATCRVEYSYPPEQEDYVAGRKPALCTAWHRGAIFLLYYYGKYRPAVLVSRSRDGDLLARFIIKMGGLPVRGSSSKGGAAALKTMVDLCKSGQARTAATVADGPRGPRYQAKPGMILLAMKTGFPLVPVAWSADRAWIFQKSWDRTMLPKPFARIKLKQGRAIHYPGQLDGAQLEAARLHLEESLNALQKEMDEAWGRSFPV